MVNKARQRKRIGCKSGEGFEVAGVRFTITMAPGKGRQFLVEVDSPDDEPVKRIKADAVDTAKASAT